jgi:hypothetical protein
VLFHESVDSLVVNRDILPQQCRDPSVSVSLALVGDSLNHSNNVDVTDVVIHLSHIRILLALVVVGP